jgi:hypothetical protein
MSHQYKELFDKINNDRRARGLLNLSWKEFIAKDEKMELTKVYRQKMAEFIEPDIAEIKKRPAAVYSNNGYESIYKKYDV